MVIYGLSATIACRRDVVKQAETWLRPISIPDRIARSSGSMFQPDNIGYGVSQGPDSISLTINSFTTDRGGAQVANQ
ncbi:hypothetical protein BGW36DRAFT_372968 [Talaromyces proteolyticus]|uniref:Uncharacterized protein n=1 Tax=Talaromyces proteolyticus TaxID=1131652 RepID=A0AAD4KZ96_9EURO|nr:uncharacterized protein BGW36DRAFT_372968 [Talaromyces proteolyticus]KAH8702498.1 hypothetical protein BGW36DRAFT_372968 [Talaromyces proteolyticus]